MNEGYFSHHREAIMKHGVCIRFVGDISLFNDEIKEAVAKVVNLTKENDR